MVVFVIVMAFVLVFFVSLKKMTGGAVKFRKIDEPEAEDDAAHARVGADEGQRMLRRRSAAPEKSDAVKAPEEAKGKKIDIDPKKLVIYSELMKPKFDDPA